MAEQAKIECAASPEIKSLKTMVAARFAAGVIVVGLMLFLPAGTLAYWQAWVYMAVTFIPIFIHGLYLLKNDPALLERRMRTRERQAMQRWVVSLSFLFILPAYILPGLDVRYGWSGMPWWLSIIADVIVLLGYVLFAMVLRANSFAARTVAVETCQRLVTAGPYTLVRHPMYLAVLIIYAFSPLALGSYWGMLSVPILVALLAARIHGEERELLNNLEGYREYVKKVRYRLLPWLW
jgi:protein-S-isoprenylcysteine O-methyltransferase Ste14